MNIYPIASDHYYRGGPGECRHFRKGEFGFPKKGEWYLSGAIPEAYEAPNDLTTEYFIGVPVEVKITHQYRDYYKPPGILNNNWRNI